MKNDMIFLIFFFIYLIFSYRNYLTVGQDYNQSNVNLSILQSKLNELEHDLTLRKLLWKSIEEWDYLTKEWFNRLLDEIKVDLIQKDVNRFTQNIYMLEKGLPHNELVPKLKEKIMDFKKSCQLLLHYAIQI